jgi:signal transduction histidine kinase
MTVPLRRLITSAVALPLLLMVASVSLLLFRLNELSGLSHWANHSDLVLAAATRAQKSSNEMDAGAGGFLLSGSDVFLGSYEAGSQRLSAELQAVVDLVADNDAQLELARRLRTETEAWATELAADLAGPRRNPDVLPDRTTAVRGLFARQARTARVRELFAALIERERALRAVRNDAAAAATHRTFWLTAVLLSAVGGLLAWFSRHQLRTVTQTYAQALERAQRSEAVERDARETAQQAVRARDNFVSLASHELKTPLTSLRLQLQTVLRLASRPEALPPDRVISKTTAAMRQVDRLAQLVGDLMDVSRLASGHLPVSLRPLDASALVRRVATEMEDDARESGCALELRAPAEVNVQADPARLEQVVVNLLTNAFKYGKGQGVIVEVSSVAGRGCIAVRDHGIGVAMEDQARIFQRFERADGAQSFRGVGLGLYIVRNLLDLMGAEVAVESELGRGSTFRVMLPLA